VAIKQISELSIINNVTLEIKAIRVVDGITVTDIIDTVLNGSSSADEIVAIRNVDEVIISQSAVVPLTILG